MRPGTAIEVRDLRKSFAVPSADRASFADRLRPVRRAIPRSLTVIDGISFEVEDGEFFGVVGRNGSGKSTLIRLLANIYAADSGTIDVRGRIVPVVELGVGFNLEHSARRNVVLSGVMLGLEPDQIAARTEQVLEFAGVRRFAEMPLRNFSTGMRTRLAFAISVEVDPDILLLDEALAVGDAAFQERCINELNGRRDKGKTIVLVTHAIGKIRQHCDRALLLAEGKIAAIGDPDEIGIAYRNMMSQGNRRAIEGPHLDDGLRIDSIEVVSAGPDGAVPTTAPIEVEVVLDVIKPRDRIGVRVDLRDTDGTLLFMKTEFAEETGGLGPGDRVRTTIRLENHLVPGEYELGIRAGTRGRPGEELQLDSEVEWRLVSIAGHAGADDGIVALGGDFGFATEPAGASPADDLAAGADAAEGRSGVRP